MTYKLIKQPAYASGDMFAICAAMVLDPKLHVALAGSVVEHSDKKFTQSILSFYRDTLGWERFRKQVHFLEGYNSRDTSLCLKAIQKWKREQSKIILPQGEVYVDVPLNYGTKQMADVFIDEPQKARLHLRAAWGLTPQDEKFKSSITKWFVDKEIELGKSTVVVWCRFSGMKGNAHPEHDTDMRGLEQIISLAIAQGRQVLLSGDKPITEKDKKALIEIIQENKSVKNLIAFWGDPSWPGQNRFDQFKTFDFLDQNVQLTHLGMRSGSLEPFALIGQKVIYMDEKNSYGAERMAAWTIVPALDYTRIELSAPPLRAGKLIAKQRDTLKEDLLEQGDKKCFYTNTEHFLHEQQKIEIKSSLSKYSPMFAFFNKQCTQAQSIEQVAKLEPIARDLVDAEQTISRDTLQTKMRLIQYQSYKNKAQEQYKETEHSLSDAVKAPWSRLGVGDIRDYPSDKTAQMIQFTDGFAEEDLVKIGHELEKMSLNKAPRGSRF